MRTFTVWRGNGIRIFCLLDIGRAPSPLKSNLPLVEVLSDWNMAIVDIRRRPGCCAGESLCVYALLASPLPGRLWANVTSFTRGVRAAATVINIYRKIREAWTYVVSEICERADMQTDADRQTHKHTDTLIGILRTRSYSGNEVKKTFPRRSRCRCGLLQIFHCGCFKKTESVHDTTLNVSNCAVYMRLKVSILTVSRGALTRRFGTMTDTVWDQRNDLKITRPFVGHLSGSTAVQSGRTLRNLSKCWVGKPWLKAHLNLKP